MGQGLSSSRPSGGRGRISSWCTSDAPCRCAVPRQSAPVSPPPMITTRLPWAVIGRGLERPFADQVGRLEVVHGQMDAVELATLAPAGRVARWPPRPGPRRRTPCCSDEAGTTPHPGADAVPRPRRWPGSSGWAPTPRCRRRVGRSHRRGAAELDALGSHLRQAAVEHRLLHLELRDPVAQKPAGALGPLVDDDVVPGPGQLLRTGQARGPRSHHRHGLPGAHRRHLGGHPPLAPAPLGDLVLDALDRDRIGVDAEHTGALARRRAQAPGELGEVVGGMQPLEGLGPVAPVHEVVPLRDEVPERASFVAEGDAAVHAARPLAHGLVFGERLVDLAPVPEPDRHRATRRQLPVVLEEPRGLSHDRPCSLPTPR